MAPFSRALRVNKATNNSGSDNDTFTGDVDGEWTVGAVPNGGYVLALVLEACMQRQASTAHPDPIHITAHYLRTTSVAKFKVHIRTLKTGKGFSNLLAELIQENEIRITTHIIFGVLSPASDSSSSGTQIPLTLSPPSSYARRHPLSAHPSSAPTNPMRSVWKFNPHVRWSEDSAIIARNLPDSPTRMRPGMSGGGGLEWGAWFETVGEEEKVSTPMLAFLVDIFMNIPSLLPKSERKGLTSSWFPTMTLSIEFKSPIPPSSSTAHSSRTVGIYSCGRFMNDPQGRHDTYVEVWTAPSNIGESSADGESNDRWRENQVCLAVASQMALTVPMSVNLSRGENGGKKSRGSKL